MCNWSIKDLQFWNLLHPFFPCSFRVLVLEICFGIENKPAHTFQISYSCRQGLHCNATISYNGSRIFCKAFEVILKHFTRLYVVSFGVFINKSFTVRSFWCLPIHFRCQSDFNFSVDLDRIYFHMIHQSYENLFLNPVNRSIVSSFLSTSWSPSSASTRIYLCLYFLFRSNNWCCIHWKLSFQAFWPYTYTFLRKMPFLRFTDLLSLYICILPAL